MDNDQTPSQTIVLFPFMAQGHIVPFLVLATRIITHSNYTVTFVNTPANIRRIRESPLPQEIKLAAIPFTATDHGLPPEAENTDSLPRELVFRLIAAAPALQPPFRALLENLRGKPACVVGDFIFPWAADAAHEVGIPHAIFSGTSGFGMACLHSLWLNLPHLRLGGDDYFSLPDFPQAGRFHVTQVGYSVTEMDAVNTTSLQRDLQKWSSSDAILFNTVEELDRPGLTYFRRKLGIPVWAIGPVATLPDQRLRSSQTSGDDCIQWLNRQPPKSVLYISFGSQFMITASQAVTLAKALAATRRSFLWGMIRPPLGFSENWWPEGISDWEKGLIIHGWVPQVSILRHESVAAFMSHCGWNSVTESVASGVPVVGWRIDAEQFFNSKMMEEMGVGVEVGRRIGGEVEEGEIMEKIEMVMGSSSSLMRKRVREIKEMMEDAVKVEEERHYTGSSAKALQEFLDFVEEDNAVGRQRIRIRQLQHE